MWTKMHSDTHKWGGMDTADLHTWDVCGRFVDMLDKNALKLVYPEFCSPAPTDEMGWPLQIYILEMPVYQDMHEKLHSY